MISDLWKSDANWFVTWFNTPAYHALYGARDEAEAVRFIQALTERVFDGHAQNVLDVGCGADGMPPRLPLKGCRPWASILAPKHSSCTCNLWRIGPFALHTRRHAFVGKSRRGRIV